MVNIENALSWVLRIGVIASAGLMLTGFLFNPYLIWLGVLLLMFTPLTRIIIAGLLFLSSKNYLFFIIAMYVLIVLVIGSLLKI